MNKFCTNCGERIEPEAKFCSKCGAKNESVINDDNIPVKNNAQCVNVKEPEKNKEGAKTAVIAAVAAVLVIVIAFVFVVFINPMLKYNSAIEMFVTGNYEEANAVFVELEDYENSAEMIKDRSILRLKAL